MGYTSSCHAKAGLVILSYFIDGTWLWAGSDDSLDVYSNVYRLNTPSGSR